VLANQYFFYEERKPRKRVAPDVMVIFGVAPGGRDSYKLWEEGQMPSVVFEVTSRKTQEEDKTEKKDRYERLGIEEYWLFDPKGEWVAGQLLGYRLGAPMEEGRRCYEPITDGRVSPLGLRVRVEGQLPAFYREDTGEKLLIPEELALELRRTAAQLEQERQRAELAEQLALQAEQRAEQEREAKEQERRRAEALAERLRQLGVDPDQI
jgi:Uma2 family endonuclease